MRTVRVGAAIIETPGKRQNRGTGVKARCVAALVALLLPQVGRADLPALRAPLPSAPATISQFQAHLPGSSTTGPATNDAEIQELARGLRYDPGLMYKFVHDHVHFTPMWGEVKGPYMTWMDRSGNAFDQASLMIALLTNANGHGRTVTDIHYVVGEITLNSSQFTKWFDVSDSPEAARLILARGGLYGAVTEVVEQGYTHIQSVQMVHVWVSVTIGGTTYEFDPSFKSHTAYDTYSWEDALEYSRTTFLSDAQRSGGGYNTSNIQSHLATYTTNLIDDIRTNYPNDDIRAFVGGASIDPVEETATPPSSVPYTVNYREAEFGIGSIPNIYRTTLQIQHEGIDQTLYSSDIYGRRLSLMYNGSNQPQLVLDGTVKATGTATTPGQAYDLTLTVDHPYESSDFDGATTLKIKAGGFYHIANGWGDTGAKILLKHRGLLQQYRLTLSDTSEEVRGESYALVGLTYLAKTSRSRYLAGNGFARVNHHLVGVTGQYDAPYLDMALGHLGITPRGGYEDSTNTPATFNSVAGHASAYEQEVLRQIQNGSAVSTPRLFEIANNLSTQNHIFTATSANWSSIQTQLVNWSTAEKDQVYAYINAGYTVELPENGDLTQDYWTGMGFRANLTTSSMLTVAYLVGNYKGGTGCGNTTLSPATLLDHCFGATSEGDPEGAYGCGSTDIAIGNGGFPFGLAFGRQYSSHRRLKDGPLGLGWTHNYDVTATVLSDSFQALGTDSAVNAAAHLVCRYVTKDILVASDSNRTLANLCESWLMDQMINNVVDIKQGAAVTRFAKAPDGSYNPPPGQALKLTQVSGNYRLKNSKGIFYDFNSGGQLSQWSDASGNVVDFTYTSGKLSSVAAKVGGSTASRTLSFTYTGDRITTVTDSASRSISYVYTTNGELWKYRNPDYEAGTHESEVKYEYDATNKGQLTQIYSPIDQVNPFLTIVYDSLGRVTQQVDANNCTWDFYRATYRNEILPPHQVDTNGVTDRFGSSTWANPDTRTVTTKDAMGRKSTAVYDAQARTESAVGPAGTAAEFSYDENHNPIDVTALCIPGSSHDDPNVYLQYGYHTHENAQGRWFVHQKQQTDAAGNITLFYYDYNDVGTYGTELGRLMKVVSPSAGGAEDANRPTVQYTYNTYGQVETQTDPNGMVTKLEYYTAAEGAGLKKTIVDYGGLNLTAELTYDSVGRVATAEDPRGNVATNEYSLGGLLTKTTPPSPFNTSAYQTTYEYLLDGKLHFVKQGTVILQDLTYNNRGQKATTRGPYPQSYTASEYAVNYTQYAYDALGRLWKVTDAENHVTTTRYWPDGKVWNSGNSGDTILFSGDLR